MTRLSREVFDNWQIRKTRKQKDAFIRFLKEKIPEVKTEERKFPRNKNIVIGDPDTAKVIYTAHYDTCARLFFPNFLTPKNLFIYILFNIIISIGLIAVAILCSTAVLLATKNADIMYWSFYGFLLLEMFLIYFGPVNKHTANDNTSGVVTVLDMFARINRENRKHVAFVLFDNEENGLLGSAAFKKKHKKQLKDKLIINFDCVSDGDNIMLIQNKEARTTYGERLTRAFENRKEKNFIIAKSSSTIYPSDQINFDCNIGVASFKKNKVFGLYMNRIHTPRDTVFDEKNIKNICDGMTEFTKAIISQPVSETKSPKRK